MKNTIKDYFFIILGCFILSIAISAFLLPANIGIGGVTGIAIVINHLYKLRVGLLTIIINTPLFLFGCRIIGRRFTAKSAIVVIFSSELIDFFNSNFKFSPLNDMLLTSIFLGVLFGISIYLIFIAGGSTGGLDILAKILKNKFKNLQLSQILMIQDLIVYSLVAYVLGPKAVMYALITSFVRTKTLEAIQEGIASSRQCIIICKNGSQIISEINKQLVRGVTVLDAVGGYSKDDRKFIYVVIQKNQLSLLKKIIKAIEPEAFVTVSPVYDVFGNYRQSLLIE